MAGLSRQHAEAQLALWLSANERVAEGQSYTISTGNGARSLTRANAQEILHQIQFWDRQLKQLSRSGIRLRGVDIR
jgi:hypothetical protein